MAVCVFCRDSAARCPNQKALHQEIGLIDFLQRAGIFPERRSQRIQSHRAAVKHINDEIQYGSVPCVETAGIDIQKIQRIARHRFRNGTAVFDFRKIPDAPQ